jgi:hypothetical protein
MGNSPGHLDFFRLQSSVLQPLIIAVTIQEARVLSCVGTYLQFVQARRARLVPRRSLSFPSLGILMFCYSLPLYYATSSPCKCCVGQLVALPADDPESGKIVRFWHNAAHGRTLTAAQQSGLKDSFEIELVWMIGAFVCSCELDVVET